MAEQLTQHRWPRRRRRALIAVSSALLLAGVVAVVHNAGGEAGSNRRSALAHPVQATPSPDTAPTSTVPRSAPTTPAQHPLRRPQSTEPHVAVSDIGPRGAALVIPKLGVDAPLAPTGAVGAPETASLTIPSDIETVAWWDGTVQDGHRIIQEDAPKPGQAGVALIAGHIDSAAAGPGALYDLKDLTPGDGITIVSSNGQRANWTVSAAPETALKTELPASLWVTTGPSKLAIVTCGGPFDSATGHYVDNVIVWATPGSAPLSRR
jgi:Sortase domain